MIFIDITHTLQSGLATGIQRVVRRIAKELLDSAGPTLQVQPVAALAGHFHPLNERGWTRLFDAGPSSGSSAGAPRDLGVRAAVLRALRTVPVLDERVRQFLSARRSAGLVRPFVAGMPCVPGPGDQVLLLDAFWGGTSASEAAARAGRSGAMVACVVYDMIPVTHPELMPAGMCEIFAPRMRRALAIADVVLPISQDCADEVRRFLGTQVRGKAIVPFRLGHDFGVEPAPTPAALPRTTGAAPIFVMVGTIEPRKGHAVVLDAFEARWRAGLPGELVFIGKIGWAGEALVARIRGLAASQAAFTHLANAGDAELAGWLARADATIMASRVEGFGLPLIESLATGTPVIASDIPVFREIGGEAVLFFKADDAASLEAAIARFLADPQQWRARAATFTWPDWAASAREVIAAMKEHV